MANTGLISAHQLSNYASPVDGQAGAASVVLGNDNTTVTGYNTHDSDPTIHLQSSAFASRPTAGTALRKWMTVDDTTTPTQVRMFYDNGSSWYELNYIGTSLTVAAGSVTTSNPIVAMTQTWNNTATTFTAIDLNVTDTNSAAASLLLNLRVGAASKFSVTKVGLLAGVTATFSGAVGFGSTLNVTGVATFATNVTFGGSVIIGGSGTIDFYNGSAFALRLNGASIFFPSISTTGTAANCFIDVADSNHVYRSTSTMRNKQDVHELTEDEVWNIVDGARAVRFTPKGGGRENIGLIAEWMNETDPRTVTYDGDGRPDWVQYPHLTAPALAALRYAKRRVIAAEARGAEQGVRITALEATLAGLIGGRKAES